MAKVGLSFENPLYKDTGGVPSAVFNPFAVPSAGSASGSDALRDDLATLAVMGARGAQLARENRFTMPEMRAPAAQPYYSPSRREFFVQGVTFGADDAQSLLESEALLGGPAVAPPAGDWEPLDQDTYSQLVANVRRPSPWQLASKSFGRGVDQLQMLAGRGLQLAGAEQLGGRIVEQQMEDLRRTQPYERQFTDIESGRDAVEWFVANLAQQGPNLLESVAVGLAGAAAGTAAAGPGLGTVAGTLAGFVGRKAFKDKVLDAAAKYRAGQLTKDSAEYAVLKNASALTGALAASYASNLGTGAADIYGEMREQGVGSDDFGARMVALAGSLPYAGLESLSEYLLAGRILGGGGRAALPSGATRVQRGRELLRRGAVGGAVGGVAEGTTELGQEALVMGLSGQDLGSDEAVNRFINAFAAGAAFGGPIGGIANLKSRRPDGTPAPEAKAEVSLLDSTGTATLAPNNLLAPDAPRGAQGELFTAEQAPLNQFSTLPQFRPQMDTDARSIEIAQLDAELNSLRNEKGQAETLLQRAAQENDSKTFYLARDALGQLQPMIDATQERLDRLTAGSDTGAQGTLDFSTPREPDFLGNIPPGAPGTQGVLDIFGGAIPAQELANRMQPPVAAPVVEQPAAPAVVDPRQGVLQFAPPAPAPTTPGTVGLALEQVLRQRQMEAAYQQRAQQEAAQREAELARLGTVAQNQRLLDLAQPPMAAPMPMRPAGPVAPRQLELFRRREAPRPSRAEGLRRGAPGAALRTPPPPEGTPPKGTQLGLFTQEGQPTVAALKSAGRKEKVAPAAPKEKVPAARGQRGLKKQAGVAAVEVKEKPSAAQEGKLKQGRVGKRAEGDEGVRAGRPAGEQPKAQVPAGGAQAGGRGGALKRGEKQEEVRPSVAAALKKGQLVQAGQQWAQYADPKTQPKWADLTDAQKEAWRKVVIDDGRPSIAAAEEVAPPKAEAAKAAAPAPTETAEERWENMEGTPFADLPAELQTRWRDAVAKGTATGDLAAQLAADAEVEAAVAPPAEERELTPAEELADNISTAQEATDIVTFREAIAPVVNYAYFAGEDTNIKKLVDQARAFLANTSFTEEQKAAMDVAFLDELQTVVKLEARYKSTTKNHQKDDPKPWFAYAESRGLLPRITVQITNLPEKYKTSTSAGSGVVARTSVPPTSEQRVSLKPEVKLGNIIQDLVSRVLLLSSPDQSVKAEGGALVPLRQLVRDLYAKVSEQGRNYIVRGNKLKDYFTADGEPKIVMSRGTPLLTTREITQEEQAAINAEQRAEARAMAEERRKAAQAAVDPTKSWGGTFIRKLTPVQRTAITDATGTLTDKEKATLAEHYGGDVSSKEVQDKIADDVWSYINKRALAVSQAVQRAIAKVAKGILNVAVVLGISTNPNINTDAYARVAASMPKAVEVPAAEQKRLPAADYNGRELSPNAKTAVDWIAANAAKNEVSNILDPITGRLYVMVGGKIVADAPALFGKAGVGAVTPEILNTPMERATAEQRITPAGKFAANLRPDASYGTIISFLDTPLGPYAIHRVYQGNAAERRAQRLETPTATDNAVSYGCINVGDKFYDEVLSKYAAAGPAYVYMLPSSEVSFPKFFPQMFAGGPVDPTKSWDAKEGKFSRDDGTPLTSTVPIGRVRLLAKNFVAKLKAKPTLHVFANVEDLKRSNPDLYRRAAAARPQGDFDTINAGGYSFGRDVIVFSDFIRTEQQLKFILAHEAIGHFGLRAVVPKGSLDTVLKAIYDADADLRAGVDAMVAAGGMPRLEAIEEYLADNAADIDNRLLVRLWNTAKNFLNKLGFTFEDDAARYLINQARKYVRRGDGGNFVNAAAIIGDLTALDQTAQEGRFARFSTGENGQLASRAYAAGALNRPYSAMGGLMGAAEAFGKRVFGRGKDVPETVAALLEQLQTLDNKARRSFGLSQVYRILERQQHYARSLLSKYQRMTSFTHSPDIGFFGKGVSEEDKVAAGELLARAALLRSASTTDAMIKKYGPLVKKDEAGNVTVDEDVRKQIERDGFVTAEEFRKGFDITYSDGGKVRFQYDVDENSPVWKVYLELRETVNEAAIDMMLANYETSNAETRRVISGLNTRRRGANVFTTDDLATIAEVAKRYQALRYADSDVASAAVEVKAKGRQDSEEFLVAFGRALFRDDVFAAWMKDANANPDIVKDMQQFLSAEYDDIRAQLPSLRAKIKNDKQSFEVQKAVRDLFMFDLQSKNADYYAKRTILGSYVPFTRRGTDQVRLVAVTEDGAPVALDENIRATLPYFQFDSRSEALEVAKELEAQFGGDNEWTLMDDTGNEIVVRLKPEVSKTRQSPDLTESVNFNEFVYILNRLNISLNPQERERIVTTLTQQNARARRNLMRSGTEGWDKDVVRSVSEHLETSAHVSAKKLFRHRMDDIMFTTSNWEGDDKKLAALKAAVDTAPTEGERARAKRAYDEYAYMYRYMKAAGEGNTVEIDGKQVPTLGRGENYKEDAKSLLRWYAETTNINDSTEDMLSGEAGSRLKMTAVLMQLGGSVATAALNLISIVTNSLPYLSYYNSQRGFGGGYGFAKSSTALFNAARDLYNPKLADDTFLREMLEKGTYKQFGLTEDEAQFIVQQTEEGTLQAAQFNALVGTARGKVFNNKAQAAIKLWMSMFSYTEQANRRVTALAAYRMEKERLQAQGVTDEQELVAVATEAARRAVNTAQGEYAMYNRPEMARGNLLQYVFMYKQFVIITTQLLRGMPTQGRLLMLGLLLLMSGLKGIPFAEDLFDLIDTVAQKLGLKMASVEKELATFIDAIAPGMTPYVMRGVIDRATGATVSTRIGMGDMLPLTGIGRAGADPARELSDFAGPVFSGIAGLIGTAGALAKYGAEAIGLRDDTTSLTSILRDSPVATLRAVTDGLVYMSDGNITNARGQMVSNDAPALTIAARFLGFYPAIASEQNDIVRLSKYVGDYAKAIKAEYVSSYVKARMSGDTERMQEILQYVRDWNEDARGTGLEITRFLQSANQAATEAARPTALRYLRSAPKQMRPETIELLTINGLMDEIR